MFNFKLIKDKLKFDYRVFPVSVIIVTIVNTKCLHLIEIIFPHQNTISTLTNTQLHSLHTKLRTSFSL